MPLSISGYPGVPKLCKDSASAYAIILEYTGLCVGLFANTCVNNLLAIHKDGSKRIDIYVMCFSLFV